MELKKYKYVQSRGIKCLVLVFISLLQLYCSSEEEEIIEQDEAVYITKNSKIVDLLKNVTSKDNEGQQCVNYRYPLNFFLKEQHYQDYKLIKLSSDEDLLAFFAQANIEDRIIIDFPISLIDEDNYNTDIKSFDDLEDTLEIALDACTGNSTYQYCGSNNKKVYVCHNGQTICVSVNALKAHQDHGDSLGECP